MKYSHLTWKELEKKTVYSCRVFSIQDVSSQSPEGDIKTFHVLRAPDWAIVMPLLPHPAGESFLMVRQWRHGENQLSLEFPGGVIEEGEAIKDAAARELEEETAYRAGKLELLGTFNPNPAIMSNRVHIFLAQDLVPLEKQNLDDDEYVDVEKVPLHEVLEGMGRPPYVHALMASALTLYLRGGRGA